MASQNNPPRGFKVEIYKIAHYLKKKMGARFIGQEKGFIAPEAIVEADKIIESLCESCAQRLEELLTEIMAKWSEMRDMPAGSVRNEMSQQVFTLAHEIKDVGSMCGYELIAYFAESLRDYIGMAKLSVEEQRLIIQAHIDAMQAVSRMGVKTDAGPEAEQLKKMVRIAIDKFK